MLRRFDELLPAMTDFARNHRFIFAKPHEFIVKFLPYAIARKFIKKVYSEMDWRTIYKEYLYSNVVNELKYQCELYTSELHDSVINPDNFIFIDMIRIRCRMNIITLCWLLTDDIDSLMLMKVSDLLSHSSRYF